MGQRELDRVRRIALGFPGVSERLSHGAICFFVQDKRPLCYFHDDHRGSGRVELWCPSPSGVQDEMVDAEPERFFRPQQSASGVFSTWLGVYLDTTGEHRVQWAEIRRILDEAYRNIAPQNLIAQLDRH